MALYINLDGGQADGITLRNNIVEGGDGIVAINQGVLRNFLAEGNVVTVKNAVDGAMTALLAGLQERGLPIEEAEAIRATVKVAEDPNRLTTSVRRMRNLLGALAVGIASEEIAGWLDEQINLLSQLISSIN